MQTYKFILVILMEKYFDIIDIKIDETKPDFRFKIKSIFFKFYSIYTT